MQVVIKYCILRIFRMMYIVLYYMHWFSLLMFFSVLLHHIAAAGRKKSATQKAQLVANPPQGCQRDFFVIPHHNKNSDVTRRSAPPWANFYNAAPICQQNCLCLAPPPHPLIKFLQEIIIVYS